MLFKSTSHFTVTNQKKNDKLNRRVLSLDLNADELRDDVTSGGRLFHVLAAVTRNARSPVIHRRVDDASSAEVDEKRKRRRPGRSATSCKAGRSAQVHGHIGTQAPQACMIIFAPAHEANADGVTWSCRLYCRTQVGKYRISKDEPRQRQRSNKRLEDRV